MRYPSFYDNVEPVELYDPLSDFLGAFEEGKIAITYLDCVKLAGHSCPTVAGAYLMTKLGLQALYGDTLPVRSGVRVEMRDAKTEGVTGVIANVAGFIAGANDEGGFKGIQGRFARNNLVDYGVAMEGEMRLTRLDTSARVELTYDASVVPPKPEMKAVMAKMMQQAATPEEQAAFKRLWQERVETILTSPELWDKMITIKEL